METFSFCHSPEDTASKARTRVFQNSFRLPGVAQPADEAVSLLTCNVSRSISLNSMLLIPYNTVFEYKSQLSLNGKEDLVIQTLPFLSFTKFSSPLR